MKILHINKSDISGGAARAAYRLHESLVNKGIDSKILVERKESNDKNILRPFSTYQQVKFKLFTIIENFILKIFAKKLSVPYSVNYISSSNIIDAIKNENPDIIHLHWIGGNLLNLKELSKIKKPIVWSLHDMWAFSGGCNYDENCNRFIKNCGKCKVLKSNNENDLSRFLWNYKKQAYDKFYDLSIIGLSKWIETASKSSSLLKDKKHLNLPNTIDTNIFKIIDKTVARNIWNLNTTKKFILFGAVNSTSDDRKGFKELEKAIKFIEKENIEFVVFGSSEKKRIIKDGLPFNYIGNLSDDLSLVTLYNAVDVILVPSLQENLSNVIVESLSCGLPVVAFDIGGNSDMIKHKENGYLAKPFDSNDFAIGINWILKNSKINLSKNAREYAITNYDYENVSIKYINYYNKLIEDNK